MQKETLEHYIQEITKLRTESNKYVDDNPGGIIKKIDLLSKCLMYAGKISAHIDEEYELQYADRKRAYADAFLSLTGTVKEKEMKAEMAVADGRKKEAKLYGDKMRWRNAFVSLEHEINSLKLKYRNDYQTGGG